MTHFDDNYFRRERFSRRSVGNFIASALRDLNIAKRSKEPEVIFKFSYDALIKLGIFVIAQKGFRIRSVSGHHLKILELFSEIIGNEDIRIIGNQMRKKRNMDLYEGYGEITEKEAREYHDFVEKISETVKQ